MATERRSTQPPLAGGITAHSDPDYIYRDLTGNRPSNPTNEGPATMRGNSGTGRTPDGISNPIPRTNNTRAPGQWGRS